MIWAKVITDKVKCTLCFAYYGLVRVLFQFQIVKRLVEHPNCLFQFPLCTKGFLSVLELDVSLQQS